MTIQSVTKSDAATRLLRMAIRLHFQDAEPLAVHTLAGAAHGLLRDLRAQRDGPSSRHTKAGVLPGQKIFLEKMVHDAKNFLKHADRDPMSVLSFNTDWTDFLLYEAVENHIALAREPTRESIFFLLWVTSKYPTVLIFQDMGIDLRGIFPLGGDVNVQKRTFLAALKLKG